MNTVTLDQLLKDMEGIPELSTRSKVQYLIRSGQYIRNKPPHLECGQTYYPCIGCGGLFETITCLARHLTFRLMFIEYKCEPCNRTVYSFNRCYLIWHMHCHDHPSNVFNLSNFVIKHLPPKYSLFDIDCSWVLNIFRLVGFIYSGVCNYIHYDSFEPTKYVLFKSPLQQYEANTCQKTVLIVPAVTSLISLRQSTVDIRETSKPLRENPDSLWAETTIRIRPTISFELPFNEDLPYLTEIDGMNIEFDYSEIDECNGPYEQSFTTRDQPGNIKLEAVVKNDTADNKMSLYKNLFEISDNAGLTCRECSIHLYEGTTLHDHFQGLTRGKPTNPNLICAICNVVMLSECSLKAHIRLHNKLAPHSCPECGKTFETHDELFNHTLFVCFHQQKLMRNRCPARKCSRVFASDDTLRTHLLSAHITVRRRLDSDYTESYFDVKYENDMLSDDIVLCQICIPSVLLKNDVAIMQGHMERHINPENKMYVYHCSYCTKIYRSKETIAQHTIQCEKKLTTASSEPKINLCPTCNRPYIKSCVNCSKLKLKSVQNHRHLNPVHFKSRTVEMLKCPLCHDKYTNKKLLIHLEITHGMNFLIPRLINIDAVKLEIKSENPPDLEMEIDDSFLDQKPQINDAHSDDVVEATGSSNDRMDLMNLSNDLDSQIKIEDFCNNTNAQIDIKMEPIADFQCNVCTAMCYTKSSFVEHIKEHRNESTQFQCMECGLCYAAKPSFTKHLLCCHSITDGEKYIEENNCVDLKAIRQLQQDLYYHVTDPRKPTELLENQCRICYSVHESQSDLNKHFRVHGMAFLMENSSHKDE